jgi:TonB family protein
MKTFIIGSIAFLSLQGSTAVAADDPVARVEQRMLVAVSSDTIPANREQPPPNSVEVDKEPTLVTRKNPAYPELARKAGVEGKVWTKIWIDAQGKVRDAQVIKSDNEVLNQAALEAAKQWVFTPAMKGSKPVAVWVTLPFNFKLGSEAEKIAENARVIPPTLKHPAVILVAGPKALRDMISYPSSAIEKQIQGAVYATVTLSDQLTVTDIKLTKGLEKSCDAAVLRGIASYDFSLPRDEDVVKPGGTVGVVVQFLLPAH